MTAVAGAIAPSAAIGAGSLNPTQLGIVPTPLTSGHAGLYAWGAATMPDGSVIIGDYWNHRVLHFDVNGNPVGSGAPGCLSVPGCLFTLATVPSVYGTPYGLAVDASTKAVYVGFECCAVEKFSLSAKGVYLSPKRIKHTGFSYPSRVAVGRDGTLYVSDMVANKIFVFNSAGTWEKTWGSFGSGTGQLNGPTGIGLDQAVPQNLYIADPGNHRIDVVNTSTGAFGTAFGTGHLGADLRGVAVDATNGFVYVVDDTSGTIHQFALSSGAWIQDIGAAWTSSREIPVAPAAPRAASLRTAVARPPSTARVTCGSATCLTTASRSSPPRVRSSFSTLEAQSAHRTAVSTARTAWLSIRAPAI